MYADGERADSLRHCLSPELQLTW